MQKELKKYVEGFYNINPDDLENEYIKVLKAFYVFSNLTSETYADQLIAKDAVKKISAQVFLQSKEGADTDKKAEAVVNASDLVGNVKKDYLNKLRKWEEYKGHKETTIFKKDMLVAIGFNRKNDLNVTSHS